MFSTVLVGGVLERSERRYTSYSYTTNSKYWARQYCISFVANWSKNSIGKKGKPL